MNQNYMIDIKKDTNFKYIFGRHDTDSIKALSDLLKVYLEVPVDNLIIKSPEIVPGSEYTENTRLDIYCSFGEGENEWIGIQSIHQEEYIEQRMIMYLRSILQQQYNVADFDMVLKDTYVLFFLDFKKYEDDDLVHKFYMMTEDGMKIEGRDFIVLITVELPKVKENPQTEQEKWAYVLKYCGDESKRKKIEEIKEELEGMDFVMGKAQNINEEEKHWLKELGELHNRLNEDGYIY